MAVPPTVWATILYIPKVGTWVSILSPLPTKVVIIIEIN